MWSLTLRVEMRFRILRVVLGRLFGPKTDEVTREWKRLYN